MDSADLKRARLVAALEDLSAQEAAAVRAGRFEEALALQHRSAPLVQLLSDGTTRLPEALGERISALLKHRQSCAAFLAERIDSVRERLRELSESQRQVARVAPAYRGSGSASTARRLCAVG